MSKGIGIVRACADDVWRLCSDRLPGGGRIQDCIQDKMGQLSKGCVDALVDAMADQSFTVRKNQLYALCAAARYTTALCTRAALITGRNHQLTGNGSITEAATGYDGYTGIIPKSTGTVAEILRQNGYATAWVGKNHNTPVWETSEIGPFDRWANGLGFDYFYGFNSGDTSQYEPILYENRNRVPRSNDPNYHLSTDIADKSIAWMQKVKVIDPDRPFFLYLAPGATHSPHQAPKEWIDKFKGQFDMGWDRYREMTFERQKKLGVIPASAKLTPRPASLPAWDPLNADQKRLYTRMMEVFAGYGAHVDHEIGRVLVLLSAGFFAGEVRRRFLIRRARQP